MTQQLFRTEASGHFLRKGIKVAKRLVVTGTHRSYDGITVRRPMRRSARQPISRPRSPPLYSCAGQGDGASLNGPRAYTVKDIKERGIRLL
ncbi:hypothetical protein DQG23_36415 [Paenibacillus contaminans]|uniref:Uncharacterized protein n=1 Tax=Paenibacillus contaminans TaxID=450362 RepID=A0A329LTE5_9BACL|nr:hypothetical protein DQG23_36415 [Paenibacillus contaminans]